MKRLLCILCLLLVLACVFAACDEHTHAYGEWSVTTAATCGAKGEEKRTCPCGESETREIAATGIHDFTEKSDTTEYVHTAPTCQNVGTYYYKCAKCTAKGDETYTGASVGEHAYGSDNVCSQCHTPLQYTQDLKYAMNDDNTSVRVVSCPSEVSDIVIPPYYQGYPVTRIGNGAFSDCENLTSVTILAKVTSIGDSDFKDCRNLTSIILPPSVTSIGDSSFAYCGKLTSIILPSSVTSIGDNAFRSCRSLTSITIPASVTSIGDYAFTSCVHLVEVYNLSTTLEVVKGNSDNGSIGYYALDVYTEASAPSKLCEKDDYIFYDNGANYYLIGYSGAATQLVLPDNCNGKSYEICKYAFYTLDDITSVNIPMSVTNIGKYAFAHCRNLSEVNIPANVKSIGEYAFLECIKLASITIPESVINIGPFAFTGDNHVMGKPGMSLTSITFVVTDGWWYAGAEDAANGLFLSATDLADPAKAAEYFKTTYSAYYWKRTVE